MSFLVQSCSINVSSTWVPTSQTDSRACSMFFDVFRCLENLSRFSPCVLTVFPTDSFGEPKNPTLPHPLPHHAVAPARARWNRPWTDPSVVQGHGGGRHGAEQGSSPVVAEKGRGPACGRVLRCAPEGSRGAKTGSCCF